MGQKLLTWIMLIMINYFFQEGLCGGFFSRRPLWWLFFKKASVVAFFQEGLCGGFFQEGLCGGYLWYQSQLILSILKSPCHLASHQDSAQSNLLFGSRCHLKIFKMATRVAYDIRTENFKQFWISMSLQCWTPTKFGLNPTYCSGADVVWRFSRWPMVATLDSRTEWFQQFLMSMSPSSPIKFQLKSDLPFQRRCRLKNFKMAAINMGTEWF